jgi:hypothetical protein
MWRCVVLSGSEATRDGPPDPATVAQGVVTNGRSAKEAVVGCLLEDRLVHAVAAKVGGYALVGVNGRWEPSDPVRLAALADGVTAADDMLHRGRRTVCGAGRWQRWT